MIIPSGFRKTVYDAITPPTPPSCFSNPSFRTLLCLQKRADATRGRQSAPPASALNYSAVFTVAPISLRCDGPPSAPVSSSSQLNRRFDRPHILSEQPLMKPTTTTTTTSIRIIAHYFGLMDRKHFVDTKRLSAPTWFYVSV